MQRVFMKTDEAKYFLNWLRINKRDTYDRFVEHDTYHKRINFSKFEMLDQYGLVVYHMNSKRKIVINCSAPWLYPYNPKDAAFFRKED